MSRFLLNIIFIGLLEMQTIKDSSARGSNKTEKNISSLAKHFSFENSNLENEGIYRTIFHNSPLGIIYFDETGKVIDCNEKISKIIGVSKEILLTINLINDLKDLGVIKQIKNTLRFGSGFYDGYYHAVNSKKVTPIIVRFNAIYSNDKIVGGVGLLEDDTNRKEAQKKIKESEYYLREAQKFSHIGHWKRDFITNKVGRSKELLRIYNLDSKNQDVPKEVFYNLIHPDDVDKVIEAFSNSLENKTEYNITFRLKFEDGTIKHVNEKGRSEYDNGGRPTSSMGIIQDVTEVRKQQLTQSASLKNSYAKKSKKTIKGT